MSLDCNMNVQTELAILYMSCYLLLGVSPSKSRVHLSGAYGRCSGQSGEMLQALSRQLNSHSQLSQHS